MDVPVRVADMQFGQERYAVPTGETRVRLEVSRTTGGYALRLLLNADVNGPCMRCLETVDLRFAIEAREVDEHSAGDEELRSPYVEGEELQLGAWVRDELALEVPQRFLCRPEAGDVCPACGGEGPNVEGSQEAGQPAPDPRWAKLRELSD